MNRKHLTSGRPASAQARRRRPADHQPDGTPTPDPVRQLYEFVGRERERLCNLLDRLGGPPGGADGRRCREMLRELAESFRRNAEGEKP